MIDDIHASEVTIFDVKKYLNIQGDELDGQISAILPSTIRFIENYTGLNIRGWDVLEDLDEGLAFIIAKFVEYFMNKAGVKGYSLSRESITYSDEIPSYLLDLLEPYKVEGKESGKVKFFVVGKRR